MKFYFNEETIRDGVRLCLAKELNMNYSDITLEELNVASIIEGEFPEKYDDTTRLQIPFTINNTCKDRFVKELFGDEDSDYVYDVLRSYIEFALNLNMGKNFINIEELYKEEDQLIAVFEVKKLLGA